MSRKYGAEDAPSGEFQDNSYLTGANTKEPIPVQSDNAAVEDPVDANRADTNAQLAQDEREAIDKSNVVGERSRHAKPRGTYREPGDEEGLPRDDGRSNMDSTSNVLRGQ